MLCVIVSAGLVIWIVKVLECVWFTIGGNCILENKKFENVIDLQGMFLSYLVFFTETVNNDKNLLFY